MARVWWCLALVMLGLGLRPATAALPESVEEFKNRIEGQGSTPEGAMRLWFEAVYVYMSGDDQRVSMGAEMLNLICCDSRWQKNEIFHAQLRRKPYIFRSYCVGAEPDNGYAMSFDEFQLRYGRVKISDDGETGTVEMKSSGAEAPRPVRLLRDGGRWWVKDFGNLYAGVKPPAEPDENH